ncbi:MAG TPA: hypothetical protein VF331_13295 [Polyangiales bacterium]
MADLEKLAVKRDHAYLVRLILALAAGGAAAVFVFAWLTGARVGGCMAETIGGRDAAETSPQHPTK